MTYQVFIKNRNYSDWDFKDIHNEDIIDVSGYPALKDINPIDEKLFSRDIIEINEKNEIVIKQSALRDMKTIAGILVLNENKTYGRTKNKKRLYYKCIPDDKYLPIFLVPFDLKPGFSKHYLNKYVIFKYDNWEEKHPKGLLVNTLGNVDNLEVFYEYQLYCKSLYISLVEFTTKTKMVLNKVPHVEFIKNIQENGHYQLEDRRDLKIITIDPPNSSDFDDGFGIVEYNETGIQIGWRISIYIANVFLWLEALDLWKTFSHRVSTIYLPDRKRPMLPTVLSDTLCSLQENQDRFALAMDVYVDMEGNFMENKEIEYKNTVINVKKNYGYEEHSLLYNEEIYTKLFDISYLMDKNIKNSSDLVSHWMIMMNAYTGIVMMNKKVGIFRSVIIQRELESDTLKDHDLPTETKRVIESWNNVVGNYTLYNENVSHRLINTDSLSTLSDLVKINKAKPYIHITSPIRRLVDLLNQIVLFEHCNIIHEVSEGAKTFLSEWISKLDYINISMRSIRKVQTDCNLLHSCFKNPCYLEMEHEGVVFDKVRRVNGAYNYMVYLENLKLMSRITVHQDIDEYSKNKFRLYLFHDEDTLKKKIKLQIIL
tara:strand:+ start:204 stop:1994 length:1791 start_codon:yes stop_codon:yes gene_type:complete